MLVHRRLRYSARRGSCKYCRSTVCVTFDKNVHSSKTGFSHSLSGCFWYRREKILDISAVLPFRRRIFCRIRGSVTVFHSAPSVHNSTREHQVDLYVFVFVPMLPAMLPIILPFTVGLISIQSEVFLSFLYPGPRCPVHDSRGIGL